MVGCCCCYFVAIQLSYDGCPTPFFGGVVDVTIMNANDKVLFNLFQCEYRTLIINTYSTVCIVYRFIFWKVVVVVVAAAIRSFIYSFFICNIELK